MRHKTGLASAESVFAVFFLYLRREIVFSMKMWEVDRHNWDIISYVFSQENRELLILLLHFTFIKYYFLPRFSTKPIRSPGCGAVSFFLCSRPNSITVCETWEV